MVKVVNSLIIIILLVVVFIAYHFLTKNNKKLKKFRKEWETGHFHAASENFKQFHLTGKTRKTVNQAMMA